MKGPIASDCQEVSAFCALFLASVDIACLAAVVRISNYVDAQGVLHEPFALMELGAVS
ncbi:MAG: DUF3955 domain-containing protein, partial [Nitratireductor sp.]